MLYEIGDQTIHVPDHTGYLLAEIAYRLTRIEEHLQLPSLEELEEAAQIPEPSDDASEDSPAEEVGA